MSPLFQGLVVSIAVFTPVGAFAKPLDCPEVAAIFSEVGPSAGPVSLDQLSELVGNAELDGKSLRAVSKKLRTDYPKASDAEIADLMITAYCRFLKKGTQESRRVEANVETFEWQVYDAVFGGPPPPEYSRQDWLTGG